MSYKVEYRIGVAAPVDDVYDLVCDIESWTQWSPIHKAASGQLKFGAPIHLEEQYEGLGMWEIDGVLSDWSPYSHIHVFIPKPFYAGKQVRYFEFEALSQTGSAFTVGALFNGFLAEREGKLISGPVKRGFTAFAEAVKAKAEADFLAKPESERTKNRLPPKALPDKLQPPPAPNWKGATFLGQKKKK